MIEENKAHKQTTIYSILKEKVPITSVKIVVNNHIDYYRPVTILYLDDSIKNGDKWGCYYKILTTGILQSSTANVFDFNRTIVQKLKFIIENGDNQPIENRFPSGEWISV